MRSGHHEAGWHREAMALTPARLTVGMVLLMLTLLWRSCEDQVRGPTTRRCNAAAWRAAGCAARPWRCSCQSCPPCQLRAPTTPSLPRHPLLPARPQDLAFPAHARSPELSAVLPRYAQLGGSKLQQAWLVVSNFPLLLKVRRAPLARGHAQPAAGRAGSRVWALVGLGRTRPPRRLCNPVRNTPRDARAAG